jgi:hypothetical protein
MGLEGHQCAGVVLCADLAHDLGGASGDGVYIARQVAPGAGGGSDPSGISRRPPDPNLSAAGFVSSGWR